MPTKRKDEDQPERQPLSKPPGKIDVPGCLRLYFRDGTPVKALAKAYGVSEQAVENVLRPFRNLVNHAAAEEFRKMEAEVLDSVRVGLVAVLADPKKLEGASVRDAAMAYDKLFQASRLIRDQSTSNIGLRAQLVLEAHERPIYEDDEPSELATKALPPSTLEPVEIPSDDVHQPDGVHARHIDVAARHTNVTQRHIDVEQSHISVATATPCDIDVHQGESTEDAPPPPSSKPPKRTAPMYREGREPRGSEEGAAAAVERWLREGEGGEE